MNWLDRLRLSPRSHELEPMRALLAAVDARDSYTGSHSVAVAVYAVEIGRRLALSTTAMRQLRLAALLHDVGKIGVPDRILNKPGPLTPEETKVMRRHPAIALNILRSMKGFRGCRAMILHHHERYDGGGYPSGLSGERIPVGARIVAVADAVDTMLSPRSYKPAYAVHEVRNELMEEMGRQFDPLVVGATLAWLEDGWAPDAAPPLANALGALKMSSSNPAACTPDRR